VSPHAAGTPLESVADSSSTSSGHNAAARSSDAAIEAAAVLLARHEQQRHTSPAGLCAAELWEERQLCRRCSSAADAGKHWETVGL
jgi:hypothetical protein